MSKMHAALYLAVFLLTSMSLVGAHAGLTISDRRYWPSEARGSPGQLIEIYPPSYAHPRSAAGIAAEPRIMPRGKAKRTR